MALEKLEGCSDAYVDPDTGITLLFSEVRDLDAASLQKLLTPFKIKIGEVTKADKTPY